MLRLSLATAVFTLAVQGAHAFAGDEAVPDGDSEMRGSIYSAFVGEDVQSSAPDSHTATGAVSAALKRNPQIRYAEASADAARANRFRALGQFLPEIEASATYSDDSWRSDSLSNANGGAGSKVGVTASQPIFTGLSTINNFRESRARVTQADLTLLSARQQTALGAARAHAGVVLARAIVDHRIENMDLVQRQLLVSEKRHKAGAQSRTGVEQARMRLAQAQVDLGQARTTLAEREAAYARVIGHMPPPDLIADVPDRFDRFTSVDDALLAARNNNPAVNAADAGLDAARFAKNAKKGEFAPSLALEGSYFKRYGEDEMVTTDDEEYQLVARMRMPIFRQGSNIAGLRNAAAAVGQEEAQVMTALRAVEETVIRSWGQLTEAMAREAAAKIGIEAAMQSVKGLTMEYEAGQRSVIDVLDGQRDLVIAQINASQASYEVLTSQYDLAAATGIILDGFDIVGE